MIAAAQGITFTVWPAAIGLVVLIDLACIVWLAIQAGRPITETDRRLSAIDEELDLLEDRARRGATVIEFPRRLRLVQDAIGSTTSELPDFDWPTTDEAA